MGDEVFWCQEYVERPACVSNDTSFGGVESCWVWESDVVADLADGEGGLFGVDLFGWDFDDLVGEQEHVSHVGGWCESCGEHPHMPTLSGLFQPWG